MKVHIKDTQATLNMNEVELTVLRTAMLAMKKEYENGNIPQQSLIFGEVYKLLIDMDAEITATVDGKLKSTVLAEQGIRILDQFWKEVEQNAGTISNRQASSSYVPTRNES